MFDGIGRQGFLAGVALLAGVGACDSVKLTTPSVELPDAEMSVAGAGGAGGASVGTTGGLGGTAEAGASSCGSNDDCSQGVCDLEHGVCVACLCDATCDERERCRCNVCEPRISCGVGLATCPAEYPICDIQHLQCEECLRTPQCGPGMECTNYTCNPPPGCENDDDCPAIRYCEGGQCRPDTCTPGAQSCPNGAAMECAPDGHTLIPLACQCEVGSATCMNRVCNPGDTSFCEDNQAMHCVDDGYSWEAEDCPALGLHCLEGACLDLVCAANAVECMAGDLFRCAPDGSGWQMARPCVGPMACDPSSHECVDGCFPGEPTCENNSAGTCDASGLGIQGPTTDCGELTCSNGSCVDCDDLDVRDAFRFMFISGSSVAFVNISGCPFDPADVWFSLVQGVSSIDVPGSVALLQGDLFVFNGSNPETLPAALQTAAGKSLMLCAGNPMDAGSEGSGGCSADQLIDFVQLGATPPTPPAGVTWTGQLPATFIADEFLARTRFPPASTTFSATAWELVTP